MARSPRPMFPWAEAVSGGLVGLAIGTAAAVMLGQALAGATTAPVPFPDAWTYRYSTSSLVVTAIAGAVVVALGFVWRAERQFVNYGIIGCGLAIVVPGTGYLALEKVEVAPDAVVYRTWWGLSRTELTFAELRQLRHVDHHRQRRRNSHWESLHYQTLDGREATICNNTKRSRLFGRAMLHALHSAGKHGVEIVREHDYGK